MFESLISQLDPLHHIFLLPMRLDILLAHELEKFPHLGLRWIVSFLIVATAWTVLVVLARVRIEQVLDDSLEFIG